MLEIKELGVRTRTKEDIDQYHSIVLFGAGGVCQECIEYVGESYIRAIFDHDEKKWGTKIKGIEVLSPDTEWEKFVDADTAIIISTNIYVREIAESILKEHPETTEAQLFSNVNNSTTLCRYKPEEISHHINQILKVRDMFADEASKEYYMDFVKACATMNPLGFICNPCCTKLHCYDTDICDIGVNGSKVIFDCGAYNGDTAKLFMQENESECEIYCIEPVNGNYHSLVRWIQEEDLKNIHAIHAGVGKERKTEKIYSTEEETMWGSFYSDRLGEKSTLLMNEVQIETIDYLAKDVQVDYIKMDIEGAEMEALRGARRVIQEDMPQMLISGYHKISDLWEIPEYVLSLNPNYKMFLGHQPNVANEPEFLFVP